MSRRDLPVLLAAAPSYGLGPVVPEAYVHPGLSLAQLLAILRAYRVAILIIMLAILALTVLIIALLPRTYAATATLMVSYDVNDPLNGKDFPIGLLGSYVATQIELMQSPEVLLAVVDRLDLTRNEDYSSGYRGNGGTLREWAASKVAKNLVVYQGPFASQLIHATYSAGDAGEAALVANSIVDIFMDQDMLRSAGPAKVRADRYAEQLEQLKAKVIAAQEAATSFQQGNGLINPGSPTDVDIAQLANLEQQLLQAQNGRRMAEARLSGDQSVGDLVLASPLIQSLKSQLAAQQVRMAEMELLFLPQHSLMLELNSQIGATRAALAAETSSYSSNASSTLAASRNLVQNLRAAVDAQRGRVLAVNRLHDDAAKYQLELESTQTVYRRALEGYDQIMFASRGGYTNVNVVSRARVPSKSTQPRILVDLLLGCIVAGTIGLLGPLAYEMFRRRVRSRDDLERGFGVPVLVEFGRGAMTRNAA
ncbi:MAG: GumC family protein [Gammaproteobacteria bacterium]